MTVIASAACMVCVPQLLYQQRAGRVYHSCGSSSRQTTTLVCGALLAQTRFTLTQLSMQLFLLHFDAGPVLHLVYLTPIRSVVDIVVAGQL